MNYKDKCVNLFLDLLDKKFPSIKDSVDILEDDGYKFFSIHIPDGVDKSYLSIHYDGELNEFTIGHNHDDHSHFWGEKGTTFVKEAIEYIDHIFKGEFNKDDLSVKLHIPLFNDISYNSKTETLLVEFPGGSLYSYADVPLHIVTEFSNSDNYGMYFNKKIRNNYKCTKLLNSAEIF